ncbi:hypothetical protein KY337_03950 [Candidatus Woesearchaeota archaeon]|nr:hypothetical protein [Candidatus Woesearchaeota archaeon]
MKKGQAAVEFALGLSILLLIFAVFMILVTQRTAEKNEENLRVALESFDDFLSAEVSTAAYVEDGYSRNFTIPYIFAGFDYSLQTQREQLGGITLVTINLEGTNIQHVVNLYYDINGDFAKGPNIIEKRNGEIFVTNG